MAKILVIDDDSHFRGIIERIILRSYTYSVRTAATEQEAWEEFAKGSFDLVLLDLYIHGKKSWDTLRRIIGFSSPPPVIVISCDDVRENAKYAVSLGAVGFLPKPIDIAQLKTLIDRTLKTSEESPGIPLARSFPRDEPPGAEAMMRLLIVEGEVCRDAIEKAFPPERFHLSEPGDVRRVLAMAREERVDAVVCGMGGGDVRGGEVLQALRRQDRETLRLPIIALTEACTLSILAALKAGADDYLALPVDSRILAGKVESHIRLRREYYRKLEESAASPTKDTLTGTYNESYFQGRLGEEFDRSLRYGRNLSVAILGWNGPGKERFPAGKAGGEEILLEVSSLLRKGFRSTDVIGRWRRDGFAVLLPETTSRLVFPRVEMIRDRVEDRVGGFYGSGQKIHCCVGLTSFQGGSIDREAFHAAGFSESILGMAHAALERAILSGTGRVEVFPEDGPVPYR